MLKQRIFKNIFLIFPSFKRNSKLLFVFNLLINLFILDFLRAENIELNSINKNLIRLEYLDSKKELEDYIIDSGDVLFIDFQLPLFDGNYLVSPEGEIFLPEYNKTYVRGLTTSELSKLLTKKYFEFINNPDIKVRIFSFKSQRVLVRGEVRNPGLYKFSPYTTGISPNFQNNQISRNETDQIKELDSKKLFLDKNINSKNYLSENFKIKRSNEEITTISDAIYKAGGITSYSNLSNIELIRDVPIGKGGGKKRTYIDLTSFMDNYDPINDIRLFDGDQIFIPKLSKPSKSQIPKSILSGLSPRFISVNVYGRIENTGTMMLPLESVLSDVIDLTGPVKPLSGKIVLIRYNKDGTIFKKTISYSATAKRGSDRNPIVKEGDLISVKKSFLGKATSVISEITSPFIGIYTTKEVINSID